MTPEELARAVERLSGFNVYARDHIHCALNIPLDKPLAALIEALASEIRSDEAGYGMDRRVLSPALDAVVRAINGEGER